MELKGPRKKLVEYKLYKVFRIKDEQYIVTVKLLAIYRWAYPRHRSDVYEFLKKLREANRQHSNQETIDAVYEIAQADLHRSHNRFAPSWAKPPEPPANQYRGATIPGWKVA